MFIYAISGDVCDGLLVGLPGLPVYHFTLC